MVSDTIFPRQMTPRLAILAYGSLIDDPGKELEPLICDRVEGVDTPFPVEFARSSISRDGAPTLVPVESGGASVQGVLLILNSDVDRAQAEDLLWRRETRNECSEKHYRPPANPGPNNVLVKHEANLGGVDIVLYTHIGSNIENLSADHLADLAIESARGSVGTQGNDGIAYLISAKKHKISTPLMPEYEAEILRKTGARSLEEARKVLQSGYFETKTFVGVVIFWFILATFASLSGPSGWFMALMFFGIGIWAIFKFSKDKFYHLKKRKFMKKTKRDELCSEKKI